jgi:tetratricopeptide (TPR) repeat protein
MRAALLVLLGLGLGSDALAGGPPGFRSPRPQLGQPVVRQGPPSKDDAADDDDDDAADAAPGRQRRKPGLADGFMTSGNFRAAISAFQRELKTNPDSAATHIGLGRALSRVGRCAEALDHLWPYADSRPFGDEAALSAAACSARLGLMDDAILFDEVAVRRDAQNVRALTNYALDLDLAGRWGERDAVLDALLVAKPDRDASLFARSVIALRRGDLDEFDALMATWPLDRDTRISRARLLAQSWLDSDLPEAALVEVDHLPVFGRGAAARELRAEALRRLGLFDEAEDGLESRVTRRVEGADIDAVRARVAIDRGQAVEALSHLADYDQSDEPEIIASMWYFARKKGDAEGMSLHAAAYRRVQVSPLRTLEKLVPITERSER